MAELAIHDPHYFNVESNQKTAVVHLFHNPIPADGPRDEGPEWAREVDDIYLIGGVGPDGPTVKTVTNGEATEWSAGGGYTPVDLTLTNNRAGSLNVHVTRYIPAIDDIGPTTQTSFAVNSTHTVDTIIIDGNIVLAINKTDVIFQYDGEALPAVQQTHISSLDYYKITLPAGFDPTTPIIMLEPTSTTEG